MRAGGACRLTLCIAQSRGESRQRLGEATRLSGMLTPSPCEAVRKARYPLSRTNSLMMTFRLGALAAMALLFSWGDIRISVHDLAASERASRTSVVDEGTIIENATVISPERLAPLTHGECADPDGRIVGVGRHLDGRSWCRADRCERTLPDPRPDRLSRTRRSLRGTRPGCDDAHPALWEAYRAQVPARISRSASRPSSISTSRQPIRRGSRAPLCIRAFYSCGRGIKVANGYGACKVPPTSSPEFPNLVYEPREAAHWPKSLNPANYSAERAVARAADARAICVKAFVETGFGIFHWPYLHTETLRHLRAAASARGLTLMVHANGIDSWRSALDAHAECDRARSVDLAGRPDGCRASRGSSRGDRCCCGIAYARAAHAPGSGGRAGLFRSGTAG